MCPFLSCLPGLRRRSNFFQENSALTSSILERICKLNKPSYCAAHKSSTSKQSSSDISQEDHDEAVASMKEEMGKPNPSLLVLKSLMDTTRKLRRDLVEKEPTSVTILLNEYPALRKPELVSKSNLQ